ncbi:MAG: hypothetical protein KA248_13790 [Kiritimatiellae bacterium]|nr:hypothetical protein [Kiritimatiellia bacterium]
MNWIALNEAQVLADFPTDLKPLYDQWIVDYPDKAGRLAEITARTVSEVRDYIISNPANTLDADTTKIPESCLRHAETMIFYGLMMEMGLSIQEEAQESMTRADIFLRQIGYQHFSTTAEDAAAPSPRYNTEPDHPIRVLPVLVSLLLFLASYSARAAWVDTGSSHPIYSLAEIDPVWTNAAPDYLRAEGWIFSHLATNFATGGIKFISPGLSWDVYSDALPGIYTTLVFTAREWDTGEGEALHQHFGFDFHGSDIRNAAFFGDGAGLTNLAAPAVQTSAVYCTSLFLQGEGAWHEFTYDKSALYIDSDVLVDWTDANSTFAKLAGDMFTGPLTNLDVAGAPYPLDIIRSDAGDESPVYVRFFNNFTNFIGSIGLSGSVALFGAISADGDSFAPFAVGAPSDENHAATKKYVDDNAGSLKNWSESAGTATSAGSWLYGISNSQLQVAGLFVSTNNAVSFCKPDGTVTGGTQRGAYSVDLQMYRAIAANVAHGTYSVICGGRGNWVTSTASIVVGGLGNSVRGPGNYAAVVGGQNNYISAGAGGDYNFIGGGYGNAISAGSGSFIGGGYANSSSKDYASLSGGRYNAAIGAYAAIGGGYGNTASEYAMIPGGYTNFATGTYSMAAGYAASAIHPGAFVWGDSDSNRVTSTATNQFIVESNGGCIRQAAQEGDRWWWGGRLTNHPAAVTNVIQYYTYGGTNTVVSEWCMRGDGFSTQFSAHDAEGNDVRRTYDAVTGIMRTVNETKRDALRVAAIREANDFEGFKELMLAAETGGVTEIKVGPTWAEAEAIRVAEASAKQAEYAKDLARWDADHAAWAALPEAEKTSDSEPKRPPEPAPYAPNPQPWRPAK